MCVLAVEGAGRGGGGGDGGTESELSPLTFPTSPVLVTHLGTPLYTQSRIYRVIRDIAL